MVAPPIGQCPALLPGTAACPALWGWHGREATQAQGPRVTYLSFQVSGFIWRGSREDSGVAEAGTEQGPHHKEEEDASNHRDGGGDLHRQVGTAAGGRGGEGEKERRLDPSVPGQWSCCIRPQPPGDSGAVASDTCVC